VARGGVLPRQRPHPVVRELHSGETVRAVRQGSQAARLQQGAVHRVARARERLHGRAGPLHCGQGHHDPRRASGGHGVDDR